MLIPLFAEKKDFTNGLMYEKMLMDHPNLPTTLF